MERLTEHHVDGNGAYMVCSAICHSASCECCDGLNKVVDQLAAYEDTCLDPKQYQQFADTIKKLDIEHMHDLLQAEMDGRLKMEPPNEPLTLDELREMNRKPIWVQYLDPADADKCEWEICKYYMYDWNLYGKMWVAYRRRPGEVME